MKQQRRDLGTLERYLQDVDLSGTQVAAGDRLHLRTGHILEDDSLLPFKVEIKVALTVRGEWGRSVSKSLGQ